MRMNFFRWILPSIVNLNLAIVRERTFLVRHRRKFVAKEEAGLLWNSPTAQRRHFAFEINYSLLAMRFSRSCRGSETAPATWTIPKKRCRANVRGITATNSLALLMIDRSIVVDATRATIKLTIFSKSNRPLSFTLALKRVLRYMSGCATLTFGRILHREQGTETLKTCERIREDEWVLNAYVLNASVNAYQGLV